MEGVYLNELIVEDDLKNFNKFWFTTSDFKRPENIYSEFFQKIIGNYDRYSTKTIIHKWNPSSQQILLTRLHLALDSTNRFYKDLTFLHKLTFLKHLELDIPCLTPQYLKFDHLETLELKERTPRDKYEYVGYQKEFYVFAPKLTKLRCPRFPFYLRLQVGQYAKYQLLQLLETEEPLSALRDKHGFRFVFKNLKKFYQVNIKEFAKTENYDDIRTIFPKLEMIYIYFDHSLTQDTLDKRSRLDSFLFKLRKLFDVADLAIYVQGVRIQIKKDVSEFSIANQHADINTFYEKIQKIQFKRSVINEENALVVEHARFYDHDVATDEEGDLVNYLPSTVFHSIYNKLRFKFINIQEAVFYSRNAKYINHVRIIELLTQLKGLVALSFKDLTITQNFCDRIPSLPYLHALKIEDKIDMDVFNFNFISRFQFIQEIKIKSNRISKDVPQYLFITNRLKNLRSFQFEGAEIIYEIAKDPESNQYSCSLRYVDRDGQDLNALSQWIKKKLPE